MEYSEIDIVWENSYPTPYANTTWLPLLLMSLAVQKNAPNTSSRWSEEYDVIIIGGGSAGSTLAGRLSELANITVLLLEAGRKPPLMTDIPCLGRNYWGTDLDWKFETLPLDFTGGALVDEKIVLRGGKCVGGSSILNQVMYVRGNKKNYNDWAAQGATGWSYKDVMPYFLKLENNRSPEYLANGYHSTSGPVSVEKSGYHPKLREGLREAAEKMGYNFTDPNGPIQTGFYDLQQNVDNGQRCSAAKAYLVPAENRTNLHIMTGAMVRKILIENNTAVGVQFDREGQTWEVKATKEVILSAGSINSPKLLMLSGIGPREDLEKLNISVVADLPVGENLQNHYGINMPYLLNTSIQESEQKLRNPVYINEYIDNRTGPLESSFFCNYMAFLNGLNQTDDKDFPKCLFSFEELSTQTVKDYYGLKEEVYKRYYGPHEGNPMWQCVVLLLQPKSVGYVKLNSADPYDNPVINTNYFSNYSDVEETIEGMKVCEAIATSEAMKKFGSRQFDNRFPGCEKFEGDEYLKCILRFNCMTFYHQTGTAKMGDPKDHTTVTDPQLRVKGMKHLRVVDASIMPISPSANTNIPTIMVAEKASDIIKEAIG